MKSNFGVKSKPKGKVRYSDAGDSGPILKVNRSIILLNEKIYSRYQKFETR